MVITWKNLWHVCLAATAFLILGFGVFLFFLRGSIHWYSIWNRASFPDSEILKWIFGACLVVFPITTNFAVQILARFFSGWKMTELLCSSVMYITVVEYSLFGKSALVSPEGLFYSTFFAVVSFMSACAGLPSQKENQPANAS